MITLRKQLLIGVAALGLGFGSLNVQAGAGEHMGGRAHGEHKMERMKERMEKRAEELRASLNLTPEQTKAWETYVAAMKPGARPQRPSREEMAQMTAPQRMEQMHETMKLAEQNMARRVTATRDFYAVLTPEQRKVFDESFRSRRGHERKGMHGNK